MIQRLRIFFTILLMTGGLWSSSFAQSTALFAAEETSLHGETNMESGNKVIYLSFDDGPRAPFTQQILDVLAKYNAKATFFVIGRQAAAQPEMIRTLYDAGHSVANHTYNHRSLRGLDWDTFRDEVAGAANAIGEHSSNCLRPPYGRVDANTSKFAASLDHYLVTWTLDPRDWTQPGADVIANRVINSAFPGAVVVLHDGGGDRSQTVAALETILARLSEQGYSFAAMCRDGAPPPPMISPGFAAPAVAGTNGISAPAANSTVSGLVAIVGAAVHPEFSKWQIDFLPFGNEAEANFLAFGESSVAEPGELFTFNTTLFPNGAHKLRLRVVRTNGNYDEYFTPVTIEN
jgi:peptidoglycan/xylan/chitin deacetylase (PgdA/CDA1 family)